MIKKEDVVIADDADDEVRTSVSQNHATATLYTEEFFLRTQYICTVLLSPHISSEVWGGSRI
jgi:hypothetical protein